MTCLRRHHARRRGFTLVELVVYLGITTLLLVATFGFLSDVLRSSRKSRAMSDAEYASRLVAMRLLQEVRSSDAVVDASSAFGTDDGRLTLTGSDGTVEFYLSAERALMVRNAVGAARLTPSSVRLKTFRIQPVAVTNPASPRSLRFTVEAESARDVRAESGAAVRSAFSASLR